MNRSRAGHRVWLACGALLVTVGAGAQVGAANPGPAAPQNTLGAPFMPAGLDVNHPAPMGTVVLPVETLGGDDLLEIYVAYCPELSSRFRIGSDGKLVLPLLKEPIEAAGLTPVQLAGVITKILLSQQILAEPSVNVNVLEYRSRTVTVVGAVLHPLTFQATGQTHLLDAIATAGGLSPSAGGEILVVHSRAASQNLAEPGIQTIPVQELVSKANPAYNITLHGGEEIRVLEVGKIFVTGNVVHPGMYPMQGDGDTTVLKALALSQGLQSYSTHVAYIYRRSPARSDREEIEVPLSRIIARKDRDVALMADDLLYIPEAKGKRMSARILSQIAGFGQTTATGLLIYK